MKEDVPDRGSCKVFKDTLRNVDPAFRTSWTSILARGQPVFPYLIVWCCSEELRGDDGDGDEVV